MVGQQLQRVGHRKAEGCGAFEIDDELVFEWELNRKIARIYPRSIWSTYDAAGRACSS